MCILRTKSSISASAAGGWCTTRSRPSSTISRSESVIEHRDLDDRVAVDLEPGHLEIDPDQRIDGGRIGGSGDVGASATAARY